MIETTNIKNDRADIVMDSHTPFGRMNVDKLYEAEISKGLSIQPTVLKDSEYIFRRHVPATRSVGETESMLYNNVLEYNSFGDIAEFKVVDEFYPEFIAIAGDMDLSETKLPFESCSFYLTYIEGRPMLRLDTLPSGKVMFSSGMYSNAVSFTDEEKELFTKHALAACVYLEVGRAATEDTRAVNSISKETPFKGNIHKTLKIVTTSIEKHISIKTIPISIKSKQRLHFRRGHWRNYSSGKRVYVKWYFAGDASIGIVTKNYEVRK